MGRLSLPGGHRASAYQVGCNGASLLTRCVQAFSLIRCACSSVACRLSTLTNGQQLYAMYALYFPDWQQDIEVMPLFVRIA